MHSKLNHLNGGCTSGDQQHNRYEYQPTNNQYIIYSYDVRYLYLYKKYIISHASFFHKALFSFKQQHSSQRHYRNRKRHLRTVLPQAWSSPQIHKRGSQRKLGCCRSVGTYKVKERENNQRGGILYTYKNYIREEY
jgi:hypothetical protein